MRGRAIAIGLGAAGVCSLSLTAVALSERHPDASLAHGRPAILALEAAVGVALVAAAITIALTREAWVAAAFFAASALALEAQALPLPRAGGAALFTLALALGASAAPLAGGAVLAYTERLSGGARLLLGAALGTCVVWAGVLPAMFFAPTSEGCFDCPRNLLLVHGDPGLRSSLLRSGLYASAVACAALAVFLFARWVSLGAPGVAYVALLYLGAATAGAASAAALVHKARSPAFLTDGTSRLCWTVECVALGLVAATVIGEAVWSRVASIRLARSAFSAIPTPEGLRVALAASAGDETLSIVFPWEDTVVTDDGRPAAEAPEGAQSTDVLRGGTVVAQLRHRELPWHASQRLAETVRTLGLALEHAASRARLRAQLTELTESRTRLVEVADGERRRLERNLHDGAQQRLIALSVALGQAQNGHQDVATARQELLAALEELRELAHGIHPASLTDAGVAAALRELADGSRVPIRLELGPISRLPEAIETAIYRLAADAVRSAERAGDGRAVTVRVHVAGEAVSVRVGLPGVDAISARRALVHAFDRVEAVAGASAAVQRGDETRVEAHFECAS